MDSSDIVKAIDIHSFLDRLEEASDIQNYYRINHLSPAQRAQIAAKMAEALQDQLTSMGLRIDS